MAATMTTASLGDTGSTGAGNWLSEHRNEAIIGAFVILGGAVYLYEKHKSSGSTGSTIAALPSSGSSTPTTVTLPGGFSFTGSGQQAAGYVQSVLGSAATTSQYANPTTVTLPNGASYTGTQSGAASFLQNILQSEGTSTTTSGGTQPSSSGGSSSITTVPSSDSTTGAAPAAVPNVTPTANSTLNSAISKYQAALSSAGNNPTAAQEQNVTNNIVPTYMYTGPTAAAGTPDALYYQLVSQGESPAQAQAAAQQLNYQLNYAAQLKG